VIVPAFNEEAVIESNVEQIAAFLAGHLQAGKYFEILVVNDGSRDGTAKTLEAMTASRPYLRGLHHERNFGRGRALQTGFLNAQGTFVITMDADLSYSPDHIAKLLAPLEAGEADVVLASAYHPEGRVENVPFGRALLSRVGNIILSRSVGGGIRTATCVVRGYTRQVIESLILFSDGKDIHLEIIQKARILGYRIAEIPAYLKWLPGKRTGAVRGMSLSDLRSLCSRHLFLNFLLRPASLFAVPIAVTFVVFAVVSVQIAVGFSAMLTANWPLDGIVDLYQVLRTHIGEAKISYSVWAISLLLLLQFFSLLFMCKQGNHHYEEALQYFSHIERLLRNRKDTSS
jgi:glycosyltransferase involved in cell wall biosynthesis